MPGQSVTLDNQWKQRNWNKSVLYLQATIVTPLEMGKQFIPPPPQKSESTDTSEGDVTTLLNQTDKIIDEEEFVDNDDDDVDDDDDDDESLQILDFRGGNILTATSVDSFDAADLLQNDMEFNDAPTSKSGKKKRILAGKKLKTSDRTNDTDYSNEYRIKKQLLSNYDKSTRPVRNDTTPITLFIGMSLYHILDTVRTPITSTICSPELSIQVITVYTMQRTTLHTFAVMYYVLYCHENPNQPHCYPSPQLSRDINYIDIGILYGFLLLGCWSNVDVPYISN